MVRRALPALLLSFALAACQSTATPTGLPHPGHGVRRPRAGSRGHRHLRLPRDPARHGGERRRRLLRHRLRARPRPALPDGLHAAPGTGDARRAARRRCARHRRLPPHRLHRPGTGDERAEGGQLPDRGRHRLDAHALLPELPAALCRRREPVPRRPGHRRERRQGAGRVRPARRGAVRDLRPGAVDHRGLARHREGPGLAALLDRDRGGDLRPGSGGLLHGLRVGAGVELLHPRALRRPVPLRPGHRHLHPGTPRARGDRGHARAGHDGSRPERRPRGDPCAPAQAGHGCRGRRRAPTTG